MPGDRQPVPGTDAPAPNAGLDPAVHFDEYEVLGYRALVGAPAPHPLAEVRSLLRGFGPRPTGDQALPTYELAVVTGRWQVSCGDMVLPMDRDFATALSVLEWYVVRDALAEHDELFHLHGAALATPSGNGALVLAGSSGSGKSTLTLALMERGFAPYADDVALIAPGTLELNALPRAFHASEDSLRLVEAFTARPLGSVEAVMPGYVSPSAWATRPLPLRWLLFLDLRPDESPHMVRLQPAEAAPAILAQSLNLPQAPRLAMGACARLTEKAGCYRFVNGDLRESVNLIERLASAGDI